jgi:hypothetical protein
LRAGDGGHGIVMFAIERDRVARGRRGAGRLAVEIALLAACATACAWARASRKVGCAVKTIWATGRFQRAAKPAKSPASARHRCGQIGVALDRGDHAVQAAGAGQQALAFQFGDHGFDAVEGQLAAFHLARQFQAKLEDRIEQRVSAVRSCSSCKRRSRAANSLIVKTLPNWRVCEAPLPAGPVPVVSARGGLCHWSA